MFRWLKRRRRNLGSLPKCDYCPKCGERFSEWFFWPGRGDYCYPCYEKTGVIYVREAAADAAGGAK